MPVVKLDRTGWDWKVPTFKTCNAMCILVMDPIVDKVRTTGATNPCHTGAKQPCRGDFVDGTADFATDDAYRCPDRARFSYAIMTS
jgi:hypothetical protein